MGILLAIVTALVLGTVVAWPLGLRRLGTGWHIAIGFAGQGLSWVFVLLLPLPYIVRITINRVTVFPVWAAVGTFMVGLVVALLQPEDLPPTDGYHPPSGSPGVGEPRGRP